MSTASRSRSAPTAGTTLPVVLLCVALVGCVAGDPGTDPTGVVRTGRPNDWLICPPAACRGEADASAPTFAVGAEAVLDAWRRTILAAPRTRIIRDDEADHWLVAEQTSLIFRFVDTIAVKALPQAGDRSSYAAYSRSNVGHWDMGLNRRRLTNWAAQVNAAITRDR